MTADQASIWIIEDNKIFRTAVALSLDRLGGFQCARAFSGAEQALYALEHQAIVPDVVLLDIGLPGMSGIEAIPKIRSVAPAARVLILTISDDDEKIFRAICAGASGYLLKDTPLEQIGTAIRDVLAGGAPINPRIASRVLNMFTHLSPKPETHGLTAREKEVLTVLVRGRTKQEIAAQLDLSFHTVDTYLRNVYAKLEVGTRQGAVAKALKERLV
jgi:DNA-binding NarL/FixJ family response regulator